MNKICIFICFVLASLFAFSEDKQFDESLSNINIKKIISPTPEHIIKQLRQLENFESYRPDTYGDLMRSPFDRKRYKFFSDLN